MVASTLRASAAAALLLSLAAVGVALQPAQPAGAPAEKREPGAQSRAPRAERMDVGESMKLIAGSSEKLRDQIGDAAKRDDNLRLINEMQRGAVNAKGLPLPKSVLEHAADEAAKTRLASSFRTDLIALIRKLLDIETEVAEGKLDAAKAHLEEALKLGDAAHGRLFPEHD